VAAALPPLEAQPGSQAGIRVGRRHRGEDAMFPLPGGGAGGGRTGTGCARRREVDGCTWRADRSVGGIDGGGSACWSFMLSRQLAGLGVRGLARAGLGGGAFGRNLGGDGSGVGCEAAAARAEGGRSSLVAFMTIATASTATSTPRTMSFFGCAPSFIASLRRPASRLSGRKTAGAPGTAAARCGAENRGGWARRGVETRPPQRHGRLLGRSKRGCRGIGLGVRDSAAAFPLPARRRLKLHSDSQHIPPCCGAATRLSTMRHRSERSSRVQELDQVRVSALIDCGDRPPWWSVSLPSTRLEGERGVFWWMPALWDIFSKVPSRVEADGAGSTRGTSA